MSEPKHYMVTLYYVYRTGETPLIPSDVEAYWKHSTPAKLSAKEAKEMVRAVLRGNIWAVKITPSID